jgi:uncharacterized GH25 family protein
LKKIKFLVLLLASMVVLPAQAHYIWLEQTGGQTKLFFGEYENNLREKTGGRLDSIEAPEASLLSASQNKLPLKRNADHIAIENAQSPTVIASELSMKVKDMTKYGYGIAKPMYYARLGSDKAEAASTHLLDIQPLGNHKVVINLRGKPLAKAKLKITAPNQWQQELDANDKGEVSFNTPWPGLYVMEVIYLEPAKGTYQGDAYENIRHVSSFSIYN